MQKHSTIRLYSHEQEELEHLVAPGSFRVLTQKELPSFVPSVLAAKCQGAVVAASASANGKVYIMCDLQRVDSRGSCIDREPLLAIMTSGGVQASATFVHHGTWSERSFNPGQQYWDGVKASGIGAFYNCAIPPTPTSGPLQELPEGERAAFEAIIDDLGQGNS